jgi:hypothetical protein
MMKRFYKIEPSIAEIRNELKEFRELLDENEELGENKHILPFFRSHKQLAAYLGSFNTSASKIDRLSFEYTIFGDYKADIVAGDSESGNYCFIECEDGKKNSIFKQTNRNTPEWSTRFEHGYSQILDWLYQYSVLSGNQILKNNFDGKEINFVGLLLIGRDKFLNYSCQNRLRWRIKKVVVDSSHIDCYTFDKLYHDLELSIGLEQEVMKENRFNKK